MKKILILALFLSLLTLTACGSKTDTKEIATTSENAIIEPIEATSTEALSLSNPASVNCITMKGNLKTITRKDGNQYSVCYFADNRQCEEWALFRGDCPMSGRKITGYDTEAQRFCAITGGEVNMNKKTCTFKGRICDLDKYYDGTCDE